MLRESRHLRVPELGVRHESIELRGQGLRVCWNHGQNVTSDYAILHRSAPFLDRLSRSCLVVILEGSGRFDEAGRRAWLEPGSILVHDQRLQGLDAYGGAVASFFIVEWDPKLWSNEAATPFRHDRIARHDLARLAADVTRVRDGNPADATHGIIERLRALGMPFPRVGVGDLSPPISCTDQAMLDALSDRLSAIDDKPSIEEVSEQLAMSSRQVNRRYAAMAKTHGLPWLHWRSLLHSTRMLTALRVLATGRASTEFAAARAGFRSPGALCHAFGDAGLPSPGTLTRAARNDVLDRWAEFAERPRQLLTG